MSLKEGLESEDPNVIKRARGVAKGNVTRHTNKLTVLLKKDSEGEFVYDDIDETDVLEVVNKVNDSLEDTRNLHSRLQQFREDPENAVDNDKQLEEDQTYIDEVYGSSDAALSLYGSYKKKVKEIKKIKQEKVEEIEKIKQLNKEEKSAKKKLELVKATARKVIASQVESMKATAHSTHEDLVKAFEDYTDKFEELEAATEEGDKVEEKYKPTCNYVTEIDEVSDLGSKLKEIAISVEKDKPVVTQPVEVKSNNQDTNKNIVKLQKISCPTFSGNARDFAQFKREFLAVVKVPGRPDVDIGYNLLNAVPGKHQHLINNLELVNHEKMMEILTKKFGGSGLVVDDVASQLKKMKVVNTDKGFVEFVEKLERIQRDLTALNVLGEIANSTIIGELESKLPTLIRIDWSKVVTEDELNEKSANDKYLKFMDFLKKAKKRIEYMTSDSSQLSGGVSKSITQMNFVTGTTLVTKPGTLRPGVDRKDDKRKFWKPCLACNVDGATDLSTLEHPMETCDVWKNLTQKEKEKRVKCVKHPFKNDHLTKDCTIKGRKCKLCGQDSHHFLLCTKKPVKSGSNVAKTSSKTATGNQSMLPVMVQAQFVTGLHNSKIGTLMDLCSTDDYVTHRYAEKKKIHGEDVELVVEGIGGSESYYKTKIYQVPVFDKNGERIDIPCYGMDEISSVASPPETASYERLCEKFGIQSHEVKRPETIDLLLSMRQNFLHPETVLTVDRMKLYEGRMGKVFGGSDPDLEFTPYKMAYPLSVHLVHQSNLSTVHHAQAMRTVVKESVYTATAKTEKEFLDYFKEENIGVECTPRCGGCKCGKCPTGAKQMSIKDEKEYEHFKTLMHLDQKGSVDDPGPYWVSSLPWILDKTELIDNKPAVLGVMNSTMRKLSKDPEWKKIYENQLLDLVKKGFAREVPEEELENWIKDGGKIYYISHQMALNPGSKSTPVRVVFNSSQIYKGYSLNSSWELGPDVMNNLHGVLLRFRKDYIGGQGDIKKMFYMVRIPKEEQMMQLFLWQFPGETRIKIFCMTRLVMGNKPSGTLSLVALKETAEMNDNRDRFPTAYQTIKYDSYVDNLFITAPDMKTLRSGIKEIEDVSAMGGFYYKPWIVSGEEIPEQLIGVKLDNAIGDDEEKALGIYWDVQNDTFYVKSNLIKPSKKPKKSDIYVEIQELDKGHTIQIRPRLTLRVCLSLHAKAHDPLGLVLPTRMIGNLLFRKTLQILKKERKGKIPWDEDIDSELKEEWIEYFNMLLDLEEIKFPRCVKPDGADPSILPDLVTFNDGNPDAYGVVAYAVFTLLTGERSSCLLMSKARLGPLTHKGETVRNELSGATLTSRIKIWLIQESGFEFGHHYHFLDSMIVLDMMKKQSYGFNTFAALRVGEIQQKTDLGDWRHIQSKENISDILTRGAHPAKLAPGSLWQCGPTWLSGSPSSWPVTSSNIKVKSNESDNDEIKKFLKKKTETASASVVQTFSALYASGLNSEKVVLKSEMGDLEIDDLMLRCGNLQKLVRCVAYLLRMVGKAHKVQYIMREVGKNHKLNQWKKISKEISASEYADAYNFLIYWEQKERLKETDIKKLVPKTVSVHLGNFGFSVSHFVLGGRVRNFPVGFSSDHNIPIIPYGVLAKLIVLYYHNKHHREVDTTVTFVRNDVWIVKARKIASGIDARCRFCLEKRKRLAGQQMGTLPSFRSEVSPSFSMTCMDLFGPFEIRDDCVKKGPRIYKKVYGVLFTCASTRAVHLDIAVDYSTESVLHTVRRLIALRGEVKMIVSDPGSQLMGASREFIEWRKGWDIEQLERFGATKGLEWKSIMASTQHQNGVSEILVKLVKGVKKSLLHALGDTKLSLNEMNTLMLEVSNLVNERPIGLQPNSRTDSEYLSPNSLLLGRSSARISSGPFQSDQVFTDDPKAAKTRFLLVQAITAQFWKVWMKIYFPSLLVRQKWHTEKRNLVVDDICHLREENAFRGEWRLCKVSKVFPDNDGKVRNVEVMVKAKQGGSVKYVSTKPIYLTRHVKNLMVIESAGGDDQDQNE